MKKDTHKTNVCFLMEQVEQGKDRQCLAFFTNEPERTPGTFGCYSHIGQHSMCDLQYARLCKKATPEQYKDLLTELESIGYNVKPVKTLPRQ